MKKSRLLSFILSFVMLASMLPSGFVFAKTYDDSQKGQRQVYLHAFDEVPALSSSEIRRTVSVGDEVNIYLAVDDPNKGDIENNVHVEPQFDLQGYTMKIYFDTKYFRFENSETPVDFKEPNNSNGFEIPDGDDIKDHPEDFENVMPGYMTHNPVYKCDTADREGYVAVTVFLMSNGFFPNKTSANEDLWYNLCRLPLIPVQTGNTSVRVEYGMGTEYDLELFAKNVEDEALNFSADVVNDGVFYINIEEAGRPTKPLATIPGGTYTDEIEVQLYHTNKDACDIYYSTNGEDPKNTTANGVRLYGQGADVTLNDILTFNSKTTLKARTYKDGKWSDLSTFVYEFLPRAPYLFNDEENLIPNIYSETWEENKPGYYVFTCDSKDFSAGISAGNTIYYTFNENLSSEYVASENTSFVGSDPESQWVKVNGADQKIDYLINKRKTIRLVTVNHWGVSEVSTYHLGIKPTSVIADPGSGLNVEQPVELKCETNGAVIYYTLNGEDPRKEHKTEYTGPIYIEEDTVIKAVSLYEGEWSDVTSFWYIFVGENKSGVSAVYPSGVYTGSVEVILYPDEPGGEIEVSFDGGRTWQDYDGTIAGDTTTVDEHLEFNARIKSDENTPDDKGDKFVYIIKPLAPVFSPESCEFTSVDVVTVFSPESTNENKDRFELWYSLDGTIPDGSLKAPENDVINIPVNGYTKITAVVVKDGEYISEIVEHTYNVAYDRPAKPSVTLPSGYYTREIGSDEFTVSFVTPPRGVTIYYTIGDRNTDFDAPEISIPGGAIEYIPGSEITVENGTMIKAIAVQTVNGNIVKSNLSVFDYVITPAPPTAPESSIVRELPLIPVDALAVTEGDEERCFVEYKISDGSGEYEVVSFCVDEAESDGKVRFYIDTKTGSAYKDADCLEPLFDTGRTDELSGSVILEIKTVLDGMESETNAYAYIEGDSETPLTPPFADKESGTYPESKTDFVVRFYSVYENRDDIQIQWKYSEDSTWRLYDESNPPEFETTDKIIYARTVDDAGNVSPSAGYIYTFNPPVPFITPSSGIYSAEANEKSVVSQSADIPLENIDNYEIFYRLATDSTWSSRRGNNFAEYYIDKTITVMAYTYNRLTGRVSDTISRNYIVTSENLLSGVTIKWPFNQSRISAHLLGKGEYINGIQFIPESDVCYEYSYTLTEAAGGGEYQSDVIVYDANGAFVPTSRIDYMTISPWINGDKTDTVYTHEIDFVHLSVPVTDLPEKNEYERGKTTYHVVNEYENDPSIIVYYTLDGSDPTDARSNRKSFTMSRLGAKETLNKTTTVKTAYFSACAKASCTACKANDYANCPDFVYGEIGEYKYPVPSKASGGGGGGGLVTVDKTRKYTKDIFGNEHPTHIGYINGYPDGSVKPEGNISREEITSILYRITNHEYEKPFFATGEKFSDVDVNRWSAHDIEYMADKEVVTGYPDGEFKPSRNLTRAEFAALITRFIDADESKEKNSFKDLDKEHWAYDDILALAGSGIMEGYPDKTYRPESNITRAEVMTVINKLLGRCPLESYVKSLSFNPFNDLYEDKWYYVTVLEATITHNYWLDSKNYEYKWEDWK